MNAGGGLIIYGNIGFPPHTYGVYFLGDSQGKAWSPPLHGENVERVFLELIAVSVTLGGDLPQCMRFGGTVQKDRPAAGKTAGIFQAKDAPATRCSLSQLP